MAKRHDDLFAETAVLLAEPLSIDAQSLYTEYFEELQKVPTLRDVVVGPRPILQADFRRGQRPNARKETRGDPYSLRAQQASDLEALYDEYLRTLDKPAKKARKKRAKTARKRTKREQKPAAI